MNTAAGQYLEHIHKLLIEKRQYVYRLKTYKPPDLYYPIIAQFLIQINSKYSISILNK